MRPQILEKKELESCRWVRITVEKYPQWTHPNLVICLPQAVWVPSRVFWDAFNKGYIVVRCDKLPVIVMLDLLDDGRLCITRSSRGLETAITLDTAVVTELREALQELRRKYPRPRHRRHPAFAAEAAS